MHAMFADRKRRTSPYNCTELFHFDLPPDVQTPLESVIVGLCTC